MTNSNPPRTRTVPHLSRAAQLAERFSSGRSAPFEPILSQYEIEEIERDKRSGPMVVAWAFFFAPFSIAFYAGVLIYFPTLVRWLAGVIDNAF